MMDVDKVRDFRFSQMFYLYKPFQIVLMIARLRLASFEENNLRVIHWHFTLYVYNFPCNS